MTQVGLSALLAQGAGTRGTIPTDNEADFSFVIYLHK